MGDHKIALARNATLSVHIGTLGVNRTLVRQFVYHLAVLEAKLFEAELLKRDTTR